VYLANSFAPSKFCPKVEVFSLPYSSDGENDSITCTRGGGEMRSLSRATIWLTAVFSLVGGASPLWADSRPYCEAFARDLANRKVLRADSNYSASPNLEGTALAVSTSGSASAPASAYEDRLWRHVYNRALEDCFEQYPQETAKIVVPVPKLAKSAKPAVAEKKATDDARATKGPKPGTEAWNKYCLGKHPSFNAQTGTFRTWSGAQRKCEWTG